jgi:hypothetical protein
VFPAFCSFEGITDVQEDTTIFRTSAPIKCDRVKLSKVGNLNQHSTNTLIDFWPKKEKMGIARRDEHGAALARHTKGACGAGGASPERKPTFIREIALPARAAGVFLRRVVGRSAMARLSE